MVAAVDVADFDFHLPDELIAQEPPPERGGSRLLVLHRNTGAIQHASFSDIVDVFGPGDVLVVNDTRVFPARLIGRRVPSGGTVECLLVRQLPTSDRGELPRSNGLPPIGSLDDSDRSGLGVGQVHQSGMGSSADSSEARPAKPSGGGSSELWEALMHPGQKLKPGARVLFESEGVRIEGEVLERRYFGRRTIRLTSDDGPLADAISQIGHIPLPPYIRRADRPEDRERYQTVYAHERGSIAAPTAGLH